MLPNLSALDISGGQLPVLPEDGPADMIASEVFKELLVDVSIVPFAFKPVLTFAEIPVRGETPTEDQVNAIRCEVRPNYDYESVLHARPKVHTLEEKGTLGYSDKDYLFAVLDDVSMKLAGKIADEVVLKILAEKKERVDKLKVVINDETSKGVEQAKEELEKLRAQPFMSGTPIKHIDEIIYVDIPYHAVDLPNYTNPGDPAYGYTKPGDPNNGPWKNHAQSPAFRYDVAVAQNGGEEGIDREDQEIIVRRVSFGTIEKETAITIANNILNSGPLLQWAKEAYHESRQRWQQIQNESKEQFAAGRRDTDPHASYTMHPSTYNWRDNLPNGRQLFTHRLGVNMNLPNFSLRKIVREYLSGKRKAEALVPLVPQSGSEPDSNGPNTRRRRVQ